MLHWLLWVPIVESFLNVVAGSFVLVVCVVAGSFVLVVCACVRACVRVILRVC